MPYLPINTTADIASRLLPSVTREDRYLEFKADPYDRNDGGKRECAKDVAQFANASGGNLVIGATEKEHVLAGFKDVPDAEQFTHWVDDVLKGQLEPVPPVEPHVLLAPTGVKVVVFNVPPALVLIARKSGEGYEFPIRSEDSKRYMTLMEVEARMGNHERLMRLRIEQIPSSELVLIDSPNPPSSNWRVQSVDDHTVTLVKATTIINVPLSYLEAVYHAPEDDTRWVVAMDCSIIQIQGGVRVRRFARRL